MARIRTGQVGIERVAGVISGALTVHCLQYRSASIITAALGLWAERGLKKLDSLPHLDFP